MDTAIFASEDSGRLRGNSNGADLPLKSLGTLTSSHPLNGSTPRKSFRLPKFTFKPAYIKKIRTEVIVSAHAATAEDVDKAARAARAALE